VSALRFLVRGAIAAVIAKVVSRWPRYSKPPRIVAEAPPAPRAELVVIGLLLAAAACAAGFVAVYALDGLAHQTQYLGLAIGLSFACLSAAAITLGKLLVPQEEVAEPYPEPHNPEELAEVEQILDESGVRFTRKRLLLLAGGAAGTALGAALVVPAAGFGPFLDVDPLLRTPWRRGRRLVDEHGKPISAADIELASFYTAFPEGADHEQIAAPLVVVRLKPAELALPGDRRGWAPHGIVAYSKICTHAGCAIALYRYPTFAPREPRPALVCPCHYSTFDPATGGTVIFGPAPRPLPQLPLEVDAAGHLRAAGNFSEPVGPSWWGVRNRRPTA
jgi:ubiquinol-cytochrome c reductase iron-sulfur subunit